MNLRLLKDGMRRGDGAMAVRNIEHHWQLGRYERREEDLALTSLEPVGEGVRVNQDAPARPEVKQYPKDIEEHIAPRRFFSSPVIRGVL